MVSGGHLWVYAEQLHHLCSTGDVDAIDEHDVVVTHVKSLSLDLEHTRRRVELQTQLDATNLARLAKTRFVPAGRGPPRTWSEIPAGLAPPEDEELERVFPASP